MPSVLEVVDTLRVPSVEVVTRSIVPIILEVVGTLRVPLVEVVTRSIVPIILEVVDTRRVPSTSQRTFFHWQCLSEIVRLQSNFYEKNKQDFSLHLVLIGSNGICL